MTAFHRELREKTETASWAENYLYGRHEETPMQSVLDELKRSSKRKKKKSSRHADPEGPSEASHEVTRLHHELQERIKKKKEEPQESLYGADGAVNSTGKARLDDTKKSVMEELRKKSTNRRSSNERSSAEDRPTLEDAKKSIMEELQRNASRRRSNELSSSSDHGLLGDTTDSMLDELKKKSKKKKRRPSNRSATSNDSDRSDEKAKAERIRRTKSLSPVPSSWDEEAEREESSGFRNVDLREYDRKQAERSYYSKEEEDEGQKEEIQDGNESTPVNYGPSDHASKEFLHSELRRHFRSPARSRSLMYKYGNYQEDAERKSLHSELRRKVSLTSPRYSRYSARAGDKSSLHDELKFRLRESHNIISPSSGVGSNDSSVKSSLSLNDHLKERLRQDEVAMRRATRKTSVGSGSYASSGSYYIPGITGKARSCEDESHHTEDTTEETPDSANVMEEDEDQDRPAPSFFIPGITGTARCLNTDRTGPLGGNSSARRRPSNISTYSTSSEESRSSAAQRRAGTAPPNRQPMI
jgi:hypothetical protein